LRKLLNNISSIGEKYGRQAEVYRGKNGFIGADDRAAAQDFFRRNIREFEGEGADKRYDWQAKRTEILHAAWIASNPAAGTAQAGAANINPLVGRFNGGRWQNDIDFVKKYSLNINKAKHCFRERPTLPINNIICIWF
jgi:hypothetical protein